MPQFGALSNRSFATQPTPSLNHPKEFCAPHTANYPWFFAKFPSVIASNGLDLRGDAS
jgi:hypothetical protein